MRLPGTVDGIPREKPALHALTLRRGRGVRRARGSAHVLAQFLRELANDLHVYYNAHQFLVDADDLRNARLALVLATRRALANGLSLLGVSAPECM